MGVQARQRRRVSPTSEHDEAELYREMDRLWQAGYSLIPLGTGDDGKSPAVTFKGKERLPLKVVWDRMAKLDSWMYGIRLDKLLVVDADTDTSETRAYIRKRFGESQVQVATSRGTHDWFRIAGSPVPSNVDEEGIAIDIKSGPNAYVVGPLSIRPDGTVYRYRGDGLPRRPMLPAFIDLQPPAEREKRVQVKGRHDFLKKKAAEYAWTCDDEEGLYEDLRGICDWMCEDAHTVSDAEVRSLAAWAWKKRLANKLMAGRNSGVIAYRSVMDKLKGVPNGCEAHFLYLVLKSNHGHIPGRVFAISPEAMSKEGLLPLTPKPIRRARDILLKHGLIVEVKRRPGFSMPNQYQLAMPRD